MMMTITTASLARAPREDIMMTTITITRVSLKSGKGSRGHYDDDY